MGNCISVERTDLKHLKSLGLQLNFMLVVEYYPKSASIWLLVNFQTEFKFHEFTAKSVVIGTEVALVE